MACWENICYVSHSQELCLIEEQMQIQLFISATADLSVANVYISCNFTRQILETANRGQQSKEGGWSPGVSVI